MTAKKKKEEKKEEKKEAKKKQPKIINNLFQFFICIISQKKQPNYSNFFQHNEITLLKQKFWEASLNKYGSEAVS